MATPLQYSCLGNPMDRGAWWATVIINGVVKSLGEEEQRGKGRGKKKKNRMHWRSYRRCTAHVPNPNSFFL